jgi:hypothetical protein
VSHGYCGGKETACFDFTHIGVPASLRPLQAKLLIPPRFSTRVSNPVGYIP